MPVEADFAVISPIMRWNLGNLRLSGGVEVVHLPEDQRPDVSADRFITEDQKESLRECEYWLVRDLPNKAVEEAAKTELHNKHTTRVHVRSDNPIAGEERSGGHYKPGQGASFDSSNYSCCGNDKGIRK